MPHPFGQAGLNRKNYRQLRKEKTGYKKMKRVSAERHIVLVHPEIPWNTGCVGRSCLGVGATLHLVEPLGFSLSAKEVKRAGLDYWPRVSLKVWPDFASFMDYMKPVQEELLFFSKTASRTFREITPLDRMILVFGSESKGLPPDILASFTGQHVHIPIHDSIRSLNLSTAVGIGLFESLRGRDPGHGW
ncbi:tRNA (cytidine(34)-2'-O)-methyltransferase [Desulfobotulus alkaliphilus]|nr:tRNA (cytidine(34)-2'-O)-methyltransferase [Desulfobotulus alkaliphilus]